MHSDKVSRTADEAFSIAVRGEGFTEYQSTFVCPYSDCRVYAQHAWGRIKSVEVVVGSSTYTGRPIAEPDIRCAKCSACRREVIWISSKMVLPRPSDAPARSPDMPVNIHSEYDEAAAIVNDSPRGAAALLRLAVQKLLPLLGATKRDINDQIGELVGLDVISRRVSDAFDVLRVIGNEAVHPGTLDLNDDRDTAMALFRLLNFIIEKAITEPRATDALFAKLPQNKRDGIEARNSRAISQATAITESDDSNR